jgi:uncharacterized HhH-GPD family protein
MSDRQIRDRLVGRGQELLARRRGFVRFTGNQNADRLLNDIKKHPHAFVIGCLMDRQIKAEKAWIVPYAISRRSGNFSIKTLAEMSRREVRRLMAKPQPLHRFVDTMSEYLHRAIRRIECEYGGDASRIWSNHPSSAELVYRFLQFDGMGPKLATMASNILVRDFKIKLADYFSIDISADVHVRRVFGRLGLCDQGASVDQIVYRARSLHPEFPGLMDSSCFMIGRTWCKAIEPLCADCEMSDLCAYARGR